MQNLLVANWKMNLSLSKATLYFNHLFQLLPKTSLQIKIIFCPSFIHLTTLKTLLLEKKEFFLGAQNCYKDSSGAYTGEVSANMLKDIVQYVIVGHSERRMLFSESNDIIKAKINQLLSCRLKPIFCCGETMPVRYDKQHIPFIHQQIESCLGHLSTEDIQKVTIAYEPIWAIGTGKSAGTDQIQEIHGSIRKYLTKKYNINIAKKIKIIYGGSCNPNNAKKIFTCPDVDGGLIGSASLEATQFVAMIKILIEIYEKNMEKI